MEETIRGTVCEIHALTIAKIFNVCVCARARVHVCVHVCVRACMHVCVRACGCGCVCAVEFANVRTDYQRRLGRPNFEEYHSSVPFIP